MIKYALADLLISIGGAFDGEFKKRMELMFLVLKQTDEGLSSHSDAVI